MKALQTIYLPDRSSWRSWLENNHDKRPGIWLIYYKKHTGKPRVQYNDAVEEAICFGWIDSTIRRIDEDTYKQKFTPRNPTSTWSEANRKRVEAMMNAGKMTEAGRKAVEIAKASGKWEEDVPSKGTFELSDELMQLLRSDAKAFTSYQKLPPGKRKTFNGWIMSAKRIETRKKRCLEMAVLLKSGKELGMR